MMKVDLHGQNILASFPYESFDFIWNSKVPNRMPKQTLVLGV